MSVRLVSTDDDLERCFETLKELRPYLQDAGHLLSLLTVMRQEGLQVAALESGGEITTVACFRVQHMLASGQTLYVDDLVTREQFRSRGHGKQMLDWLQHHARGLQCETFSLDSGTFRQEAHAFYFREGMRITSFHFARKL